VNCSSSVVAQNEFRVPSCERSLVTVDMRGYVTRSPNVFFIDKMKLLQMLVVEQSPERRRVST